MIAGRIGHAVTVAAVLAAGLAVAAGAEEPYRFRSDDPVAIDHDALPSPLPDEQKVDDYYDGLENMFAPQGEGVIRRARNINTVGEVPDSSWFTNRLGVRAMTVAEMARGPDRSGGPAPGTWTVVGAKSRGITPGFTIADSRGDRYLIKFDPKRNLEMATAAEVISTKFFHALGYHVPENYIVTFDPPDLVIGRGATTKDVLGNEVPITDADLARLLGRVAKNPDGTIRALASKFLPGRPVGPFLFHSTRRDDRNDVFPHEHRRELRGYYVFCSWLHHDDSRSINTLDMYLGEPGQGHVRHHLIDFGSTLGSGSVKVQHRRGGYEYMFEGDQVLKGALGLGFWIRPYADYEYPRYPSLGRFSAAYFEPDRWKPEYRNVAFDHMDLEDAFWAAKLVMRFRDEAVRAVVATGQLSNPEAERYLADALIERRDRIGRHWLAQLSSLDDFRVDGGVLRYRDLLVDYGFAAATPPYRATFSRYHNPTGAVTRIAGPIAAGATEVAIADEVLGYGEGGVYFLVTLESEENPAHVVDLFLRAAAAGGGFEIVGIDRRAPRRPARRDSYLWESTVSD